MKKVLFTVITMLLPLMASADVIEINDIYYNLNNEAKSAEVTSNPNLYTGEVVIPKSIEYDEITYDVTSIGYNAFNGCSGMTSIEIPNSVKSIGSCAFWGCSSLTTIEIPNGVTCIESFTFIYCTGLTSVTIPNSVMSIRSNAFEGCSALNSIDIPNSVTSIGNGAFWNCCALTSVEIPNSVTRIESGAFEGCNGLTSIVIPKSVTSIEVSAFANCSALNSIVVENDNTVYDSREVCNAIIKKNDNELIVGCKNTTIPNTVTTIGVAAFSGCSGLTSIVIPNSVTKIGESAFSGCSGLTSVIIPNGVTTIGDQAFDRCSSLTSIDIPNNLASIENAVFYGCSSLTSIDIPSGVTSIGGSAFNGCSGLTSIDIPNSVTSIGDGAFANCSSLSTFTIPNSVIFIGNGVFDSTAWLDNQPNGLIYKDNALLGYKGNSPSGNLEIKDGTRLVTGLTGSRLTSVTFPNSLTCIGNSAFFGCGFLNSIEIPNSVTSIGEAAFWGCTRLTSVTIGNGVTSIGGRAFNGCTSLTSVTIGNGVTSIGASAFNGCSALTSLTIPGKITSIEYSTFNGCRSLTSVMIPGSVTSIGGSAFNGCTGLKSVIIGNGVTTIDYSAFGSLSKLTDVYCYAEKVPEATWAFNNTSTNAIILHVPEGLGEAYKAVEPWSSFKEIVEIGLKPIDVEVTVSYGEESGFTEETNLKGTVMDNMYYNIGADAGGYQPDDGCIVITKDTSDEQMAAFEGQDITSAELFQYFTGIIFKVPAGSGNVTITAETTGNMTLKVKVGNGEPQEMELSDKLKMNVPYKVSEESLVYIYAGTSSQNATRGLSRTAELPILKIYGIEWELDRVAGDVNGDGNVNGDDLEEVVHYIMGNPSPDIKKEYADVNCDNEVNAADIVAIVKIMKKSIK
jgi:hypothetical protein